MRRTITDMEIFDAIRGDSLASDRQRVMKAVEQDADVAERYRFWKQTLDALRLEDKLNEQLSGHERHAKLKALHQRHDAPVHGKGRKPDAE